MRLNIHLNSVPVISFGITGVIWSWTFHSGPPVGLSTKYCPPIWICTGSFPPIMTTLATDSPRGTVQRSPLRAFQSARMLPE